jgi:hypothetical protein
MGPWESSPAEASDTLKRSGQSTRSLSTKNLPQEATELEVEQPATDRLEDVGSPAEVHSDSTVEMEGDHVADLMEGCRPNGTWLERP